jgi:hypothetical protein
MVKEGYEHILAASSQLFCGPYLLIVISREIDKEEFKKVMALMRSFNRQGAAHRDGLRTGFKVGQSVENGGLVEYFFGNDGNEPLHFDKFTSFMKELHDEVICFFPIFKKSSIIFISHCVYFFNLCISAPLHF